MVLETPVGIFPCLYNDRSLKMPYIDLKESVASHDSRNMNTFMSSKNTVIIKYKYETRNRVAVKVIQLYNCNSTGFSGEFKMLVILVYVY